MNPRKPGKIRRACNAAAASAHTSLNDQLLASPDLLISLIGILVRFREERIAFCADIEAMFSQVAVQPGDQVVLRFLWRESSDSPVSVYQFLRHISGAKSFPASANYVLRRNAHDNSTQFPTATEEVLNNFYMDDLFKSEENKNSSVQLQSDLTQILSRGGFRLTKWCSNSRKILSRIPR